MGLVFILEQESRRAVSAAQQCVHPTSGSLRVFRHFARLEVGFVKIALSRLAHLRVTPAVGRSSLKTLLQKKGGQKMVKKTQSRPILVWVISIIFSLMALSQIISQSLLLFLSPSLQLPEVQSMVESWSVLDRVSPYVVAILLLVSMVQLFRLQRNSVNWLAIYIGLVFLLSIQQAITTKWIDNFGVKGLISAFGGIVLFLIALGYMLWLRKREVLT